MTPLKHWLFVLPIDERTTRVFFLFYFKSLKVPLVPIRIPRFAMYMVLSIANRRLIGPLLSLRMALLSKRSRKVTRNTGMRPPTNTIR